MDSESEDDVYKILLPQSPCCIPELYVARTRLRDAHGHQYDFWGLFCDRDLKKGECIGMYSGVWVHADDSFEFGSRYAIELSYGMMVAPPGQRPDPRQYPIAMANEPRPNTNANATLSEWVFDRDEIHSIPAHIIDDRFYGAGLVACEDIRKCTEIRWHYGPHYSAFRDYNVGNPCIVATNVHPPQVLGRKLPYNSVSPVIDSPFDSDDSDEDPTYRNKWSSQKKCHILQKYREG